MTTQYTPILALALPVTGELSGTWGDVVNDNITSMVEQAIAGLATINTWAGNGHTLTTANGTTSESRCAMLVLTDTGVALTGAATVICPTASKIYIVKNTSGQSATITTAAGTGVSIPNGETMFVFCDGTNVVQAVTRIASADVDFAKLKGTGAVVVTNILDEDNMASDSATALATQQSIKAYVDSQISANNDLSEILANGNTTGGTDIVVSTGDSVQVTDLTASVAVFTDASKNLVSNAITGTGNVVMSTYPTLVTPALGTPASGVVTNLTGTASININGTVGATTPSTGAFTTLSASGTSTLAAVNSGALAVTGAISSTTGANFATSSGNVGIGGGDPATRKLSIAAVRDAQDFGGAVSFVNSSYSNGRNFYIGNHYAGAGSMEFRLSRFNNTDHRLILSANESGLVTLHEGLAVTGAISATEIISANKGITFPATQVASADANTLDDYEEGTFTPSFESTGISAITYGTGRNGYYTKVGRLVTVTINIMTQSITVTDSSAVVTISGLPFTVSSSSESTNGVCIGSTSRWTSNPPTGGVANANSTSIYLYRTYYTTGGDPVQNTVADMGTVSGNKNIIRLTTTYFV